MSENRDEIINFFLENKDWFIKSLTKLFPLEISLIEKYVDVWDWKQLSKNENVWNLEFFEKYKNKLEWRVPSGRYPWTDELIEKYKDKLNWGWLGDNVKIKWTPRLLEKFKDNWDWGSLSYNMSLPWTMDLIEQFEDKWEYDTFCWNNALPWTIELIDKYRSKWNWEYLSEIDTLPWSCELIEKYKDKWDWNKLVKNKGIPWDTQLLKKYKGEIGSTQYQSGWNYICENVAWNEELLMIFEKKLNWERIALNTKIMTYEFISKYKSKLHWRHYINKTLPWSIDFLIEFEDKLNWSDLSGAEYLPWTTGLFKKFENKWNFYYLSTNTRVPFTQEIIQQHVKAWNWKELSKNTALPWSLDFYNTYKSYLNRYMPEVMNHLVLKYINADIAETVLLSPAKEGAPVPVEVTFSHAVQNSIHWQDSGYFLKIVSGKIIACEPFQLCGKLKPFKKVVPQGDYPVKLYEIQKEGLRVALAMVLFLKNRIKDIDHWEAAIYENGNTNYGVDMATGCFTDYDVNKITSQDEKYYDKAEYAFEMSPCQMVVGSGGLNIIAFSTGMGDGCYSSYWGMTSDNKPVCLVTDFNIISG